MRLRPSRRPDIPVASGERLLAWAEATDGRLVGGTRDALYLGAPDAAPARLPWEQVSSAEWDQESSVLRIVEVGGGEHAVPLDDPRRLLQLVRERVTASVVLQRRVAVRGRRGFRVLARRPPGRASAELSWVLEYDPGIDPDDPEVRRLAEVELAAARSEVGER